MSTDHSVPRLTSTRYSEPGASMIGGSPASSPGGVDVPRIDWIMLIMPLKRSDVACRRGSGSAAFSPMTMILAGTGAPVSSSVIS
jgi:hypothetical protein